MKLKKHNRYSYSPITERQDFTYAPAGTERGCVNDAELLGRK